MGAIIARMKSPYRGVRVLLAMFVVGLTCMGQVARPQAAAPSDDAQALVKQRQKLNSDGCKDGAENAPSQRRLDHARNLRAQRERGPFSRATLDL